MKARRQKRALDAAGDTAPPQPLASAETGKTGPFAQATSEAQNRPAAEPPPARDDETPWVRTPPPEKVDPGMLVPTPPPENVDPGMLTKPQQPESIETPSGTRAKERKSVLITPEAARYVIERARHHTGRFGIASFGWQLAAEELKKRATITDGVIRLHPPSPLDRFVEDYKKSSRGARAGVWDFVESATRRAEWDEAKASGDPDRMTRAANRLIDEENAQRARMGKPPLPVEQILNPPEGANAHANKPITDADKQRAHGETGKSQQDEYEIYDPNAAHTHPRSDSDVGPGEIAEAPASRTYDDAPLGEIARSADAFVNSNEHTPLTAAQAKIAASIVMMAPAEQQEELLRQMDARFGAAVVSQVTGTLGDPASRGADADELRLVAHAVGNGGTSPKFAEMGAAEDWQQGWNDFWEWFGRVTGLGGPYKKGRERVLPEDYEVEQPTDAPLGSQLGARPLEIQREELDSPLDPNWSPSQSRYDPPDRWRRYRNPNPRSGSSPFAETGLGKILIGIDELDADRRAQLERQQGTWLWPTGYPPTSERLDLGFGYFGSSRVNKGVETFHGGLDFKGDPDRTRATEVRMPTGARIVGVKEDFHKKIDPKTKQPVRDKHGRIIMISEGYTLSFDLGNGMRLELRHVKPSEEILALMGGFGNGPSSRFIPRGAVLGTVDRDAYEGDNDHVHVQITMDGGKVNGRDVTGFAIDPFSLFDVRQQRRHPSGGGGVPLP